VKEGCIPEGNIIQWSVDVTEELNCLKEVMKVVERIYFHRIWQQINIDDMQFGFMKGNGTTDANFIVRQMQKFRAKGKKCYFGFADLEKAFDRVLRSDKMGNA